MELREWARTRLSRIRANVSRNQHRHRSPRGRTATVLLFVLAGLMITVAAVAARGPALPRARPAHLRALPLQPT